METSDAIIGRPIDIAAVENRVDVVELLLGVGVSPNEKMSFVLFREFTLLQYAATSDNAELAELLLKYGANRETASPDGETAAQIASRLNNTSVLRILDAARDKEEQSRQ